MEPSITSEAPEASSYLNSITPVETRDHRLVVQFTGSGSEYFRIWIVNLLLMLVTLGFYYPWAKVRRLRYFYGNTIVDSAPLDFHGDPKKMLRGYLLTGVLVTLYSTAGNFSAIAGLVAFVLVAALWPALFKSSMQFRLANTSWRGLRFRFKGGLPGAYRAMVPLFIPAGVLLALLAFEADARSPSIGYAISFGAVVLATLLTAPWLWWNLKSYQHNHYALGQMQTELRSTVGAFYGVFLKTAAVALLCLGVLGLGVLAVGLPWQGGRRGAAMMIAAIVGLLAVFVLLQIVVRPYFTSRMQNLLWSRTGNSSLRFRSQLSFRSLARLTLKNWLLMLLTLGLYGPFAAIALARLRLQAVSVTTRVNPDTLLDQMRAQEGEAAGDAAGDLLGLDIGL
jgi:uncharacterized membrane protein YjgN (DUF898 family)